MNQPLRPAAPPEVITLGIDPGTAIVGYGFVGLSGNRLRMIACGAITTPSTMSLPLRLKEIYTRLSELIGCYHPTAVAIEELFFARNVRTALTVGQARGVAVLAAMHAGIEPSEYTPLQVKAAVVGYGRASKAQVGEMVRVLLALSAIPTPDDAADALAIAICHSNSQGSLLARYYNR